MWFVIPQRRSAMAQNHSPGLPEGGGDPFTYNTLDDNHYSSVTELFSSSPIQLATMGKSPLIW